MVGLSARDNILLALNNEIPDYVHCCPDISNIIPVKMAGKPFWEIYLNKDPPLGLAQIFAVNRLGVDDFSDQGQLDPSPEYNERFKETIIQTSKTRNFIDTKTTVKTVSGEITFRTRYYSYQLPILIEKPIAASNGGYKLSTGDQCPKETPIENIKAMVKATRKYGRY